MLIVITAMSYSQANLKPPGLRKRKSTITVTDDELQRQKHSKMTAGDGPESIDSTATAEPTDEIKPVDPTIIEPDEENDRTRTVYPSMVDMLAKMKLEQEIKTEKLTREGRRVLKQTLISERCTSCGVRILHMGKCDDCRICTTCGQQRSLDGKCQVCAKLRCEEWRLNVDQSPISDSALKSRAMDVLAHQHDQINPTDELEKHLSRPDAINSKPEVDKLECAPSSLPNMPATEEPENDKDAVAMWKSVAISLLTMQSCQLILDDDSEADIWKLAAGYMSEIQLGHGSERALPGIDFITFQNDNKELGIKVVPLQQMERLLAGIPDAQVVAFFILSYMPEEHHALLSCTRIFAEEHTSVWRGHVLFEEWSEEESDAFACEFSRLVCSSCAMKSVLEKWLGLLEVSWLREFSYNKG